MFFFTRNKAVLYEKSVLKLQDAFKCQTAFG